MSLVPRLLLALLAALACVPSALAAGTGMAPLRPTKLLEPARPFHDSILRRAPERSAQARDDAEGTYTTADGATVARLVKERL